MDPSTAPEGAERDQLWASLRALRPEIEPLAAGELDLTAAGCEQVERRAPLGAAAVAQRRDEIGEGPG
jgi:hypothetical protein